MIRLLDLGRVYRRRGLVTEIHRDGGGRSVMFVYDDSSNGRTLVVSHVSDEDGLCHPVAIDAELRAVDQDLALEVHTHVEKIRWVPGYVPP